MLIMVTNTGVITQMVGGHCSASMLKLIKGYSFNVLNIFLYDI